MVGLMRMVYVIGCYRRMASLTLIGIILTGGIPTVGNCSISSNICEKKFAKKIFDQIETQNSDLIQEEFDQLHATFSINDPLIEGKKMFQSMLDEANVRYGYRLTIPDACVLIRENLHILNLSPELKNTLLETVDLYQSEINITLRKKFFASNIIKQAKDQNASIHLYWPWEWSWFGLNKNNKSNQPKCHLQRSKIDSLSLNDELPGNCYIGGCELLAGALIAILPIPGAKFLGGVMVGDGIRRIFDGTLDLDNMRKADPNYIPPTFDK